MLIELPYFARVIDGFLPTELFNKVMVSSEPLRKYHAYDDENARKKTSVPEGVSGVMLEALEVMARTGTTLGAAGVPDMTFYGAGVSIITAGDFLRPHVDHAFHPVTGKTRMSNLLLYLTESDGGELRLIGPDAELKIKPKPNRAILFQSFGNAVHAVEPVKSGERIALSVYFYSDAVRPTRQNQKAEFV